MENNTFEYIFYSYPVFTSEEQEELEYMYRLISPSASELYLPQYSQNIPLEKPKKLDIYPRQFEKSDSEKECSICQNRFSERDKVSELHCKHCYHYSCIKEWTKIKSACPLCRKNIPALER